MPDELDRALAGYANAAPRPGLEGRIQARLAAEARRRTWLWIGSALTALLCLVIALSVPRRPQPRPLRIAETHLDIAPVLRPTALHPQLARQRKGRSAPAPLPKLDTFPTAPPLTDEEKALLALVRRDPEGAVRLFQSLEENK